MTRRPNFKNEIGNKFGQLKVIKEAPPTWNGTKKKCKIIMWLCRCSCGNEKIVSAPNLRSKNTVSCGCYRKSIRKNVMRSYWNKQKPFAIEHRYYMGYKRCEETQQNFLVRFWTILSFD